MRCAGDGQKNPIKIVVDTNVLISGIFFGGKPREILKNCVQGCARSHVSEEIISEYDRVLLEMQKRTSREIPIDAYSQFLLSAKTICCEKKIDVCCDSDDNKFIDCAISANASYIVSGDKDLLVLQKFDKVKIVTVSEFLEVCE